MAGAEAAPVPALTIHYRRLGGDYAQWALWLWPVAPGTAVAPTAALPLAAAAPQSAWGAVFRVPLAALPPGAVGLLPFTPGWARKDAPERTVAAPAPGVDAHVFVLEGDGSVHASPLHFSLPAVQRPRFLAVALAPVPGSLPPWLVAGGREVFPGTSGVCFVDRAASGGEPIGLQAVCDVQAAADACAAPTAGARWRPGRDAAAVRVVGGVVQDADGGAEWAAAGVEREAATVPGFCRLVGAEAVAEVAAEDVVPAVTRVLRIHYRSLRARGAPPALLVRGARRPAVVRPPVSRVAVADPGAADLAVFAVDLSTCPEAELAGGLRLTLVARAGAADGEGPAVPTEEGDEGLAEETCSALWIPSHGLAACLLDGGRLIPAAAAACAVAYHRFDDAGGWEGWELRLTEAGHEEDQSVDRRCFEVKVRPPAAGGAGPALFDLPMAVAFPQGAVLRAQPVKVATHPGAWVDGPVGSGERHQLPPRREIVKQDVVRTIVVADILASTGMVRQDRIHFVQASVATARAAPARDALEAQRFATVDYRRHADDDHRGWDLWCFDDTDAPATSHAVQATTATKNGLRFVVDRASFGGGAAIQVLPRLGGDAWREKDEPARVLPHSAAGRSPLFTAQGMRHVLESIDDARAMLRAHVESQRSILIESPVPFEWLADAAEVELELDPAVVQLDRPRPPAAEAELPPNWRSLPGRHIPTAVERASPVALRVSPAGDEGVDALDEDFPVESTIVSLVGFAPCGLRWREHDDWDQNLYPGVLGWEYSAKRCVFRCFAPTADAVHVVLYAAATGGQGRRVAMRRIPEGCWKATVDGDLKGGYYKLLAEGADERQFPGVEVIDPYSRCNTGHAGRGLIFGTESTPVAPRPHVKPEHTIVYELHIRDATIDPASGVKRRGKYLGLAELGTALAPGDGCAAESDDLSTCLSHIVGMGVTAVQILPVQDFDNDEQDATAYKWGYMPVHFNSPDGWYASETSTVARVTEFKLLVDALHRAGLKVIMDVVYNHTAEDGNELNLGARFSFNGLAPRYYYRNCLNTPVAHNGDSTCAAPKNGRPCGTCASNGSGCGNEFRSESPMGRKFILDSLRYWADEYKVDGFRFDLLGLIDVETVTQAAADLRRVDPNIVLYGEPWCGGLTPIQPTEKGMQRGRNFGVFNDTFRDALRGSPFAAGEETFVMDGGRLDAVKRGIIGSIDEFTESPLETINYVECHDNYTLHDHFLMYIGRRTDDIKFSDADVIRMHKLAAAILFTSQGIPMMQMGQEMCRTKFGVENSYESPDAINMVRWEAKRERADVVAYYRGLIELRRRHPELFCMTDASAIRSSVTFYEDLGLCVPPQCIAYRIVDPAAVEDGCWNQVVVLLNAQPTDVEFALPDCDDFQHWLQVVSAEAAGREAIGRPVYGAISVGGRSAAILRRASSEENRHALVDVRLRHVTDGGMLPSFPVVSPYMVGLTRERAARGGSNEGWASPSRTA